MMSSTERFVVVVGVCLLVLNVLLFGLCLALVLDSHATRSENAQVLALTYQMLEKQESTAVPSSTAASSTAVPRAAEQTTPAEAQPSSEEPVAADDATTAAWRDEELDTEETESGTVVVTGTPGLGDTIARLEREIAALQDQLSALKESLNKKTTSDEQASEPTTESSVGRRRRRRRGREDEENTR